MRPRMICASRIGAGHSMSAAQRLSACKPSIEVFCARFGMKRRRPLFGGVPTACWSCVVSNRVYKDIAMDDTEKSSDTDLPRLAYVPKLFYH
jgi:hypothetical protein